MSAIGIQQARQCGAKREAFFLAFLIAALSINSARAVPPVEIRFCPPSAVRVYPLESQRGIQSLLLHNAVCINHGNSFAITALEVELLQSGKVIDSRKFDKPAVKELAEKGVKLQASGMLEILRFQFCGTNLIPPAVKLAGPVLEKDQALIVTSQIFAYSGPRDTLRVLVHGNSAGQDVNVTGSLPIIAGFSTNSYLFPLRGIWFVGVGPTPHTPHRWAIPEEFALDIARLGSNSLTHAGTGTRFEDYYAYSADVLAAADGKVIHVENDQPEDPSGMQKPGETDSAYLARLSALQMSRIAGGAASIAGNYVMIDHGNREYGLYAHLKTGSARVHAGDQVKAGQVIGKLGSSGNSTEPHLHFQLCDGPDPLMSAGIPITFRNAKIQWAESPRALQSGDVVTAE